MSVAECPSCSSLVDVAARAKLGDRVVCKACNTELEVVWLDPIELDWPYDDESYYEDEEYAYYDDDDA